MKQNKDTKISCWVIHGYRYNKELHIQQRVIWWLHEDFVQIRLLWHPIVTKQTSLSQISTLKKKEQKNVERVSEETCQSVSRTVKICRTLQCQKRKSDISQLTQRVIATSWVNSIYFPDKFKPLFLIYSQPKKCFKLATFSQHKVGCPKTIS